MKKKAFPYWLKGGITFLLIGFLIEIAASIPGGDILTFRVTVILVFALYFIFGASLAWVHWILTTTFGKTPYDYYRHLQKKRYLIIIVVLVALIAATLGALNQFTLHATILFMILSALLTLLLLWIIYLLSTPKKKHNSL